jgi:hypothetical protein
MTRLPRQLKIDRSNERAFWSEVGKGYELLCRMSDDADWTSILHTIGTEIATLVQPTSRIAKILDLGAGTGIPASELSNFLLSRFDLKNMWTLVEPDEGARLCCRYSFPDIAGIPGSANVFATLEEVPPSGDHDVALLMHSTYEISDLRATVELLRKTLRAGAPIFCLALPQHSPFFALGGHTHGSAEEVEAVLSQSGYGTKSIKLVSRIHVLTEVLENPVAMKALKMFANCGHMADNEFVRLVRVHWGKNVDFGDHLVIAVPMA